MSTHLSSPNLNWPDTVGQPYFPNPSRWLDGPLWYPAGRRPRRFATCAAFLVLLATVSGRAQVARRAPSFERLASGTEYQLFRRDAAGHYVRRALAPAGGMSNAERAGQTLFFYLQYRTNRDSLLLDTRWQRPAPLLATLSATPPPASVAEALGALLPGDSAVFRFPSDTAVVRFVQAQRQPMPAFLPRYGASLRLTVVATQLLSPAQMRARAAARQAQDDAFIRAYLDQHQLMARAKKTAGGTWYVLAAPGRGPVPAVGQTVRIRHRGTLLATGAVFSATDRPGDPMVVFVLGQNKVIQGMEQAVAELPVGSKATLFIPSPLGYGEQGSVSHYPPYGLIPSNAPLGFEVEVVDVK